jgi:hypothetical protein
MVVEQLVSAAGFEPATHALKDHRVWGLPRILTYGHRKPRKMRLRAGSRVLIDILIDIGALKFPGRINLEAGQCVNHTTRR